MTKREQNRAEIRASLARLKRRPGGLTVLLLQLMALGTILILAGMIWRTW